MAASNSSKPQPEVAIVTVSYGSENVLPQFLESVSGSTLGPFELIVVDNNPNEASPVERMVEHAGGSYIRSEYNSGYGTAVNTAVQATGRHVRWVLVSNPDVTLGAGCIDILVSRGDSESNIGSVGPAMYTAAGDLFASARTIPSLRNGIGHALFARVWPTNPWSAAYYANASATPGARDAGWLSGACLLVRRSAFEKLGGFDPGFFMYFEDVDLGYRLGKAGFRNVYEPAAQVTHSGAHSTSSDSERMIAAHHVSAKRFLHKKYSAAWLWPLRVVLDTGLSIRSALLRGTVGRKN